MGVQAFELRSAWECARSLTPPPWHWRVSRCSYRNPDQKSERHETIVTEPVRSTADVRLVWPKGVGDGGGVGVRLSDYSIRQDDGPYLDLLKIWEIGILGQMRHLTQLWPYKSGVPGSDLSIGRHGSLLRVGKDQNRGRDFG